MHITTTDEKGSHKRELWLNDETRVSSLYVNDLMMRIGSVPVPLAGIGGVHTEWEHRHKGYMRILYEDTVSYMITKGYCVSALFGIANFYNKWQYVTCLANYLGKIKTRIAEEAQFVMPECKKRLVEKSDMPSLIHLYNQQNATRSGSIFRDPVEYKEFQKGSTWEIKADAVLWEDNQGSLLGYGVSDKDQEAVVITEVECEDDRLFPAVLYTFAEQAAAKRCEHIQLRLPSDHPFATYIQRFGMQWEIHYPRHGDGMMRILNLKPLFIKLVPELERRLAETHLHRYSGSLTIITDLGPIHLAISKGKVAITEDASESMIIKCPHQVLMQLLLGYRGVRDALIEPEVHMTGDAVPLMQTLFPSGIPYMYSADHF